jgi:hypothetical protein
MAVQLSRLRPCAGIEVSSYSTGIQELPAANTQGVAAVDPSWCVPFSAGRRGREGGRPGLARVSREHITECSHLSRGLPALGRFPLCRPPGFR